MTHRPPLRSANRLRWRLSIRVKLLAPILVAFFIAFITLALRLPPPIDALVEDNLRANFSTRLHGIQGALTHFLRDAQNDLLDLVDSPELNSFLTTQRFDNKLDQLTAHAALASRIVGKITEGQLPYAEIRYVSADNKQVVRATARLIGSAISGVLAPEGGLAAENFSEYMAQSEKLPSNRGYLLPPTLSKPSEESGLQPEPLIEVAIPVYYQARAVGTLIGSFRARSLLVKVFQQSGVSYQSVLADRQGQIIAVSNPSVQDGVSLLGDTTLDRLVTSLPLDKFNDPSSDLQKANGRIYAFLSIDNQANLPISNWLLVVSDRLDTVFASVNEIELTLFLTLAAVFIVATGGTIIISQSMIQPLVEVSHVANRIAAGDLEAKAPLNSNDEVGMVAFALNTMSARLTELIRTLEARIYERTRDLEVAADVSRQIATILDAKTLLQAIVERTKTGFNLYRVSVFVYHADLQTLMCQASTSQTQEALTAERLHVDLFDQILIAEAARKRIAVLGQDASSSAYFLANNQPIEILSEMAAPMIVGDRLVGVLDFQSEIANRFSDDDVQVMTSLASQVAVALKNAQAFSDTRAVLNQLEVLYSASDQMLQAKTIDDLLLVLVGTRPLRQLSYANIAIFDYPWREREQSFTIKAKWSKTGQISASVVGQSFKLSQFPSVKGADPYKTLIIKDIATEPALNKALHLIFEQPLQIQGMAIFPLIVNDEHLGFFAGYTESPLTLLSEEIRQIELLAGQAASVYQTFYLLEETSIARHRAEKLYANTSRLLKATTIHEVLSSLIETTPLKRVDRAAILYFYTSTSDAAEKEITVEAEWQRSGLQSLAPVGTRLPLERFPFFQFVSRGKTVIFADVMTDVRVADYEKDYALNTLKMRSLIFFPIMIGQECIGVVSGQGKDLLNFSEEEIHEAELFIAQAGAVTANFRLLATTAKAHHETEQRANELEIVAKVSAAAATQLDLDELLQTVTSLTQENFGLSHTFIYLLDRTGKIMILAASAGEAGAAMRARRYNILLTARGSLTTLSAREGRGVIVNDVSESDDYLPNPLIPKTRSEMAIPMIIGDKLIGVLDFHAETIGRFSADDLRVMTILAEQIAIAVENARLFRESELARQRAEIIAEINSKIARANDEQSILEASLEIVTQYNATRSALTYLQFDEHNQPDAFEMVAMQDKSGPTTAISDVGIGYRFPLSEYPLFNAIYIGENTPVFVENAHADSRVTEAGREKSLIIQLAAYIFVPLTSGGRWQALLIFGWDTPQVFEPKLRIMIEAVMPRLADNIAGRRAFLASKAAREESELLYLVSQEMNAAQSFTGIVEAIAKYLNNPLCGIGLSVYEHYDKQQATYFEVVASRLSGEAQVTDVPVRWAAALIADWTHEGLFIVEDMQAPPNNVLPSTSAYYLSINAYSIMVAGLVMGKRVIGLLNITYPTPRKFTVRERRFARAVADLAAAAVERTHLFNEQVLVAEQLREVDNMKSHFLASMSHELRTPLNAILNFSKFVANGIFGPVNAQQVDALHKTIDSGKHLLSLINDVLDITKIESQMLTLFVEQDINLGDELNTVIATATALLADKPVSLVLDIDPDLPPITGDRRRIRQVLLNLVSNACKFTESGSITVSAHIEGDMLRMFVKDTGPGIAPEDHDLIFEAFRQTNAGLSQGGGTGLGLAIARRLVEAHGGRLWLESVLGEGSTFFVLLPLKYTAKEQAILS